MRKVPFAEWFISQDIGIERGSALYGDLEELAATRGRLWFWTMYFRALISLGWRAGGSAFITAIVASWLVFRRVQSGMSLLRGVMVHFGFHQFHPGLFGESTNHASVLIGNMSIVTASFLFFAVPFLLVRFGWRDRLTKLAILLLVITVPAFTIQAQLIDLSGLLMLAVIAFAFLFRHLRKEMTVLSVSFFASAATSIFFFVLQISLFQRHYLSMLKPSNALIIMRLVLPSFWGYAAFAVGAVVCLRLRRGAKIPSAPHACGPNLPVE
jgi:hypothetical protein